jgi:uncharacterized protein (DUF433 family)
MAATTSTTSTDIGTLISKSPEIKSGRPVIAGTGVMVMRIANYYKMGYTAEEIMSGYGHLSLAQVYAALAYYHANREEIEADIAEEEALYEKYSQEYHQKRLKGLTIKRILRRRSMK